MRLSPFLVEKTLDDYSKLTYHNREHTERMLEGFGTWVDANRGLPDILVRIGEASILFHDVQYVISRNNNEEVACEYARKALEPCGWNKYFIQAVCDIIMTTVPFTDFSPTFNYFPRTGFQKGLHDLVDIIHDLDWFSFSSEEMVLQNHEKIFQEAYYHIGEGFAFIHPEIDFLKFDIRKNQYEFYRRLKEKVVLDGYLFRSEYFNYISLEETLFNIDAVTDKARDDMYYAYQDLKEEVRKWNEENPDCKKELPPDLFEEEGQK